LREGQPLPRLPLLRRPNQPVGGCWRPPILLPVVDELLEKVGGSVHGVSW